MQYEAHSQNLALFSPPDSKILYEFKEFDLVEKLTRRGLAERLPAIVCHDDVLNAVIRITGDKR